MPDRCPSTSSLAGPGAARPCLLSLIDPSGGLSTLCMVRYTAAVTQSGVLRPPSRCAVGPKKQEGSPRPSSAHNSDPRLQRESSAPAPTSFMSSRALRLPPAPAAPAPPSSSSAMCAPMAPAGLAVGSSWSGKGEAPGPAPSLRAHPVAAAAAHCVCPERGRAAHLPGQAS